MQAKLSIPYTSNCVQTILWTSKRTTFQVSVCFYLLRYRYLWLNLSKLGVLGGLCLSLGVTTRMHTFTWEKCLLNCCRMRNLELRKKWFVLFAWMRCDLKLIQVALWYMLTTQYYSHAYSIYLAGQLNRNNRQLNLKLKVVIQFQLDKQLGTQRFTCVLLVTIITILFVCKNGLI